MKVEKYSEKVNDIINNNVYCPLPLKVIPNHMGINLCAVESVEWKKQSDGQLISLQINFNPEK